MLLRLRAGTIAALIANAGCMPSKAIGSFGLVSTASRPSSVRILGPVEGKSCACFVVKGTPVQLK